MDSSWRLLAGDAEVRLVREAAYVIGLRSISGFL